MIGILCGRNKERLFADLVLKSAAFKTVPVLIFSMPDVNLSEKTVYGALISGAEANIVKTTLPSHIYNFSVQHTKSHIKKLKQLLELENVTVYNPANSFNQWSIMKILKSDAVSAQYLFPFDNVTKGFDFRFEDSAGFILRPRNGNDPAKITYCAKTKAGFDIYNIGEIAFGHLHDIRSAVNPIVKNGKWLVLFTPELTTYKNRLFTARGYLYKTKDKSWALALKTVLSQTEETYGKTNDKPDEALIRMAAYVNNFIPDLAFCAIDFTLDKDGNPYFLALGGWQDLMPRKALHKPLADVLCGSLASKHSE